MTARGAEGCRRGLWSMCPLSLTVQWSSGHGVCGHACAGLSTRQAQVPVLDTPRSCQSCGCGSLCKAWLQRDVMTEWKGTGASCLLTGDWAILDALWGQQGKTPQVSRSQCRSPCVPCLPVGALGCRHPAGQAQTLGPLAADVVPWWCGGEAAPVGSVGARCCGQQVAQTCSGLVPPACVAMPEATAFSFKIRGRVN